jgi:hypothetical protein
MNGAVSTLRAMIWWVLPLAALATLIAKETDFGRALRWQVPPPAPVPAKPVNVSLLPEYTIDGGVAKYGETVSRPLFVPTRRPAPVPVVEVAKPKMQKGQFTLTGTTVAGERSLAFLKETNGGKSRTVKQGDSINGMLVAEVKPDRVKLTQHDESEELVLKVISNPKSTPQAIAQAQPGAAGAQQQLGSIPGMVPQQQPGQPAQPAVAGAPDHNPETQTLAERRRAARAAQAAAAAAQEASAGGQAPAPPPQQPAAAAQQPETGWAQIYQRYQQRRN